MIGRPSLAQACQVGAPARLVTIPATAGREREPAGIPFVLTQAERSKAAQYKALLERNRRQRNAADSAQRERRP